MSAVTIIIDLVLIIVSIILIITVLMQQGQREGLGAIGGGAETFFGKNKAKSYEGKLALFTKIGAVVFIVLAIVATITTGLSKNTAPVVEDVADTLAFDEEATEDFAEGDLAAETTEEEAPVEETPVEEEAPVEETPVEEEAPSAAE